MNDLIISSDNEQADGYKEHQEQLAKNAGNILKKDDDWYYNDKMYLTNTHMGKLLSGGPKHLQAYYQGNQKETQALIFGRAQHCLLFEPEMFESRFYAIDDTEICEEIGGKVPRATKKYKEWKAEILDRNTHRQELSIEDMTDIKNMIEVALSIPQVKELVDSAKMREVIYEKTIKEVKCKCKVDAINSPHFILDYKSTRHPATLFNWPRIERERRYNRQASFYRDITGARSFWWILQEKTYPYTVALIEQSEDSYQQGVEEYELAIDKFKKFFINGNADDLKNYFEMGML